MVKKKTAKAKAPKPAKDEQIGFHKGAVATLMKERQELVKMINIVDALLRAHLTELKKLGVELTKKKG